MKTKQFNLFYPYKREETHYPTKDDLAYDLSVLLSKSDGAAKTFYNLIEEKANIDLAGIYLPFINLNVPIHECIELLDDSVNIYGIVLAGNDRFYNSIRDLSQTVISDNLSVDMLMSDGNDVFIIDCDPTNSSIIKDNFDKISSLKEYAEKEGVSVNDIKQCQLSWGELHHELMNEIDDIIVEDYITNFNEFKSNLLSAISLDQILEYTDERVKFRELQKYLRNGILDYYEILLSSNGLDSLSRMKINEGINDIYEIDISHPTSIDVLNSNLSREDIFDKFQLNFDAEYLYIDILFGSDSDKNKFYKEFDIVEMLETKSLDVLNKKFKVIWAPILKAYGGPSDPVEFVTSNLDYTGEEVKESFDEILKLNRTQLSRSVYIDEHEKEIIRHIYEELDQEKIIFNKDNILRIIDERLGNDLTNINPSLMMRVQIPLVDIVELEQSIGELIMVVLTLIL